VPDGTQLLRFRPVTAHLATALVHGWPCSPIPSGLGLRPEPPSSLQPPNKQWFGLAGQRPGDGHRPQLVWLCSNPGHLRSPDGQPMGFRTLPCIEKPASGLALHRQLRTPCGHSGDCAEPGTIPAAAGFASATVAALAAASVMIVTAILAWRVHPSASPWAVPLITVGNQNHRHALLVAYSPPWRCGPGDPAFQRRPRRSPRMQTSHG